MQITQLNYILINKKWINSTLKCEAHSSFEGVSSNQRIISEKKKSLELTQKIIKKNSQPHLMDWSFSYI